MNAKSDRNVSKDSKKHFRFAFAPSRFPSKIQLLIPEALSTSLLEELYRNKANCAWEASSTLASTNFVEQSAELHDFSEESCFSAVCRGTDACLLIKKINSPEKESFPQHLDKETSADCCFIAVWRERLLTAAFVLGQTVTLALTHLFHHSHHHQ